MAVVASLMVASLALPMPAAAQFTEGYKLLESVRKKEGQTVTDMLEKGGPNLVNYKDYSTGETALHIVTARRDLLWMEYLVGKGANVNARDAKGVTPLVIAANLGFVEGVEFLIERGAKIDESNNAGETPLITAVHNRNTELMRVLLTAGADPDRADNSGRSARDYALFDGK
ncbi:ankyrin repeat domain-containing protein, partial [Novosphingobium sp.]|uniref:ankyrin repeat domain-containing protein n=1 Tax=Novosphingobium sp. TaxID=1874826 RepID=UPI0035B00DC7